MSIDDIVKLQPTESDQLPEGLATIDSETGDAATVIIPTAEGWRHGSDTDLLAADVKTRSKKLTAESVERVLDGELSAGELAFLSRSHA